MMYDMGVCKFCYSNGEAESQYRSHQLKSSSGLVTCPVLRSFVCPICKATGDFAHTQRYCPRNKNGHYNTGASLTDLKRRKNAAGNFPTSKKSVWPIPSQSMVRGFYTGTMKTVKSPKFPTGKEELVPRSHTHPMTMTDPLPSCYRPPSPPVILASQPPCTQLTMYRHYQYIKYYHEQQIKHKEELDKLAVRRQQNKMPGPCYTRTFPSTMSVTPPESPKDRFIFPEVKDSSSSNDKNKMRQVVHAKVNKKEGHDLGSMLAELRVDTVEVDL